MGETRERLTRALLRSPLVDLRTGVVVKAWQPWYELVQRAVLGVDSGLVDVEGDVTTLFTSPAPLSSRAPGVFPAPVHLPQRREDGGAAPLTVPMVQRLIRDAMGAREPVPLLSPASVRRFDRNVAPRTIPRTFAQGRGTTTPTTLYSPASGTLGTIKQLIVANTTAGTISYRVFIDIDGTTYDENSSLFWDVDVPGNTSDFLTLFLPMNAAANLGIQSSANDSLTFTLGGTEIVETFLFTQGPLGQLRPAVEDVPESLVNPSTNSRVLTSALIVSNVAPGGKAAVYSAYLDTDGTTYDETTALAWQVSLGAGQTDVLWPLSLTLDDPAGNLAVETNDGASELCFTAFGFAEAA